MRAKLAFDACQPCLAVSSIVGLIKQQVGVKAVKLRCSLILYSLHLDFIVNELINVGDHR